jgi:ribulose-5-phosphate 4-epimerase/fuculose-1-phosphate aldolase
MDGGRTIGSSVRDSVGPAEWETRVKLAACRRLVDRYGMSDMIYTHISARVPGEHRHFLIDPHSPLYREITASSLIKIDLEGKIAHRPEARCVLHTHTRAGITVSTMKCGLPPLAQHAMRFHGRIGYHDYEGPAVDLDERARLVADLGPHDAMILRKHRPLACGQTIEEPPNAIYRRDRRLRRPSLRSQRAAPLGHSRMAGRVRLLDPTDTSYRD